MKHSEITLIEAIEFVSRFSPVKIVFNDIILYNDYDENAIEIEDGVYGENNPHSIVTMRGYYKNNDKT